MIDRKKIKKCLEMAQGGELLAAVKELDLNEEEAGLINDLMIKKVRLETLRGRSHTVAATEHAEPSFGSVLTLVEDFTTRQARMERHFTRLVDKLGEIQGRMSSILEVQRGLLEEIKLLQDKIFPDAASERAVPEAQETRADWKQDLVQGLREIDAGTKVVRLANRRPPTRTPPGCRKGA